MQSGSKGTKHRDLWGGVAFSENEERTIHAINTAAESGDDANRKIGKAVAKLVEDRGGIAYGDETLKRLASHPALRCSEEHLRRCWQYHRFLVHYGPDMKGYGRQLKFSHYYQISRLLDIPDEKDQRDAITDMAARAVDEELTVTEIQRAVSSHLAGLGRAIKGKPKKDKPQTGTTTAPEQDPVELVVDMSKTVVTVAERITETESVPRLADLRYATNRLGFAYSQLVKKLVAKGDEETADAARKVITVVAAAIDANNAKGGE